MSRDFQKGKIYKITNDFNNDVYVGSTCDTLIKRFNSHKRSARRENKQNVNLYKLINEIGFNRFRIDLICDFPCNDMYELRQKEGEYIRSIGTLNMCVAGRSSKDYYKEESEKRKEYQEKNKENKKEYDKERRENLHDYINEKIECVCGGCYTRKHMTTHFKTKKHINYIDKQTINSNK